MRNLITVAIVIFISTIASAQLSMANQLVMINKNHEYLEHFKIMEKQMIEKWTDAKENGFTKVVDTYVKSIHKTRAEIKDSKKIISYHWSEYYKHIPEGSESYRKKAEINKLNNELKMQKSFNNLEEIFALEQRLEILNQM